MRAVHFVAPGEAFQPVECPTPKPAFGEVLVRVAACGLCASDLHLRAGWFPSRAAGPFIPGHEPAGTVEETGDGVPGFKPGDRVAVGFAPRGCRQCAACRAGGPDEDCAVPLLMGMDFDGALAEFVVVPAAALVRLPDSVGFDVGAVATDAVATAYNAVVDVGGIRPGHRVVVLGTGGVGIHAVQIARLAGAAAVLAVDIRQPARDAAMTAGADMAAGPAELPDAADVLFAGRGADLAIDCSGVENGAAEAIGVLAAGGCAVLVGVGAHELRAGPALAMSALRLTLRGAFIYRRRHLVRVLDLISAGRLDISASISKRFPLQEIELAVAAMRDRDREVTRVLLCP